MLRIAISLTAVSFVCLFLLGRRYFQKYSSETNWKDAFLFAFTAWAGLVWVQVEGLSLFHGLTTPAYTASWSVVTTLLTGLAMKLYWRDLKQLRVRRLMPLDRWLAAVSLTDWLYYALLATIFGLLGFVAAVYLPNNFDSMTYHLPKVMHWAQNHSVGVYATWIQRQVQLQPMAEYLLLNFYLLSKTDRLFNFVQLGSLAICALGVSQLTAWLGGSRFLQRSAVLFCLSIPLAIMQATSTQNDLVAASFLVCFVYFSLHLADKAEAAWLAPTAVALGLAMITKAYTYVYALPFVIYAGVSLIRRIKLRAFLYGGGIALIALAFSLPHFARMQATYGSITSPSGDYLNQVVGINVLASNAIRNLALNYAPTGQASYPNLNSNILAILKQTHQLTGLDPLDKRTSWPNSTVSVFDLKAGVNEDKGTNPEHAFIIFATAILALVFVFSKRNRPTAVIYALIIMCGFLLFSLFFRWQQWGLRLLLPLIILWAPAVAVILFSRLPLAVTTSILAVLTFLGAQVLFHNDFRPLDPPLYQTRSRNSKLFIAQPFKLPAYTELVRQIAVWDCKDIGLIFHEDVWEYPLWKQFPEYGINPRIEHIQVTNPTGVYASPGFSPCAILTTNKKYEPGQGWSKFVVVDSDWLVLFLKK